MGRKSSSSPIGDFVGSIGPVVLSESYGVGTVRCKPVKRGKEKSEEQEKHTKAFKRLNEFLQDANDIINMGYQQVPKPKMSAFNAAVSWHFYNALATDQTNGIIDFEKLRLSSPIRKTQKAWQPSISAEDDCVLNLTWKLNPLPNKCTRLDDEVVLVVVFPYHGEFRFATKTAIRNDLNIRAEIPYITKEQYVHCYLFMRSADKKLVSETQYLGEVRVKP